MIKDNNTFQPQNIAYSDNWEFLSTYLKEMDFCLFNLQIAIEKKDTTASRSELHQMLGASRILNYSDLVDEIIALQSIIKGKNQSQDTTPLLTGIHKHLEELYRYLVMERPSYDVYLMSSDVDYFSSVQGSHAEIIKTTFSSCSTLEERKACLSSNDVDLIIYDYDGNLNRLKKFSAALVSSGIETPILLVSQYFSPFTPGRDSDIASLRGRLLKIPNLDQLVEGVKCIVNGRDYWPE